MSRLTFEQRCLVQVHKLLQRMRELEQVALDFAKASHQSTSPLQALLYEQLCRQAVEEHSGLHSRAVKLLQWADPGYALFHA